MASEWTVSIDDSSPIIQYLPHGDGGVGDQTGTGWQPWFTDSGGFNAQGGNDGLGMSYHVTAFSGARFDFQFYGTGVSLYGNTSCSYEVSIDGASKSFTATEGTLFTQDGLPEQMHNVSVTADASASNTFWFDRADISRSGAGAPKSVVYPATNTTVLKYSGNWKVQDDPNGQIPSKEHPAPFYEVSEAPASVSFSFQGTGVAVNGSRNWGGWTYAVNLDGNVSTYNASTMWLIGDALLFYRDGLDPQTTHTVNITPSVGGGLKFWLNSVTFLGDGNVTVTGTNSSNTTSPSSSSQSALPTGSTTPISDNTSSSNKPDVGVIVGATVGGIAALLILAALAIWYRRRRRAASAAYTSAQFAPYVLPIEPTPGLEEARGASKLATEAASPYSGVQNMSAGAGASSSALSPPASAHPGSAVSFAQMQAASPPGIAASASSGASSVSVSGSGSGAPQSPASAAAVDRLIQIIAERIDRTHPVRYEYGADVPPPQYDA